MSDVLKKIIKNSCARSGPLPESFALGDGINWSSPLHETLLYVELPFWLMIPPGPVEVRWSGVMFTVDVCSPWMEVFVGEITDSRVSCLHQGPLRPNGYEPSKEIADLLDSKQIMWLHRPCKTMLRLTVRAQHSAS